MKIYGLFRYSYDHFEFERVLCVSQYVELLEQRHADIKKLERNPHALTLTREAHGAMAESETTHYAILELKVISDLHNS